jgi:hypothetical protein
MKYQLGVGLLLFATFGAPPALADLVDYTIAFSGAGILPTAGSFTYDSNTATFSSFEVTWDLISFDLTAAANSPVTSPTFFVTGCLTGLTGGVASFTLLSGECALATDSTYWFGETASDHSAQFGFVDSVPLALTEVATVSLLGPATNSGASGDWIISKVAAPTLPILPSPVPESGSLMLLVTVFAVMGLLAPSRFKQNRKRI